MVETNIEPQKRSISLRFQSLLKSYGCGPHSSPRYVFIDERTHTPLSNLAHPFLGEFPIIKWIADAVSFAQSCRLREREITANNRKSLKDTFARPRLL